MKITRRAFLQTVCCTGGMVALGALSEASTTHLAAIRPPGGEDAKEFLALCLKCNKCVDACPTGVTEVVRLENGLLEARTPILNFHLGYCTFCGDCVEACPSGALRPVDIKKTKIGVAKIIKENCIAWKWGGCTACKTACTYGAITMDATMRPVVDENKCNGCGQCEYMCPAAKVRSFRPGQDRGISIVPLSPRQKGAPSA